MSKRIPNGYDLSEFIAGYERRNGHKLSALSFSEVRALSKKFESVDPTVSAIIEKAYAASVGEFA